VKEIAPEHRPRAFRPKSTRLIMMMMQEEEEEEE
jgi:hypothetical protein